jgi:UDP-glucose:tetrahydrobiopterin glucosyltransferase
MLKLLFISTPVGYLGSGQGGGVELTVQNVALALMKRGHRIQVVAPVGSILSDVEIIQIPGTCQIPAQIQERNVPVTMPGNSVLANMWEYARNVQQDWDAIVNFAFDWLPFYLTPFFHKPIAHAISMASTNDAFDEIVSRIAKQYPHTLGVCTQAQADTFPFADVCEILGNGIDLSLYQFVAKSQPQLAWVGRIAPEKALEDAVAAAEIVGIPLKIFGKIQDVAYWEKIQRDFPNAPIEYVGFLSTVELQAQLGACQALLMTPRWIEAFGNVAIEALACGVPVIAYRRGGPGEIVRDRQTGFLVEPDSISGLVEAIGKINSIDRALCRQQAREEFSLEAIGARFEAWLNKIKRSRK